LEFELSAKTKVVQFNSNFTPAMFGEFWSKVSTHFVFYNWLDLKKTKKQFQGEELGQPTATELTQVYLKNHGPAHQRPATPPTQTLRAT
jgi:hypothetical protein